jgi:hydrogenase maturation protease
MSQTPAQCLILACGNTLRSDDGVGLWLAEWAARRFAEQSSVRVLADHQWTPELAEDVARSQSVLFLDCSLDSAPGSVQLTPVEPSAAPQGLATHHQGAADLLALSRDFYSSLPQAAMQLTIGAASTELGETFSDAVAAALPGACTLIEKTVLRLLGNLE